VAFNNITRLAFGKRFMDSNGVIDEQGKEFKTIVSNGNCFFILSNFVSPLQIFTTFRFKTIVSSTVHYY
jgi:hypothetical protein